MKVIRKPPPMHQPCLWTFLKKTQLPPSMRLEVSGGYGVLYYITASKETIAEVEKAFWPYWLGGRDTLKLLHPQYFRDMQALLEAYEQQTGRQTKLVYWADA